MINLYIIRHGQSVYQCLRLISGQHEYGLSAIGEIQTKQLGKLIDFNIDYAFISDSRRTYETYEILKRMGKMPPPTNSIFTPLLRERDQGVLSMMEYAKYDIPQEREWKAEGGESWVDVQERIDLLLEFFTDRYLIGKKTTTNSKLIDIFEQSMTHDKKSPNIAIVTHQGFIKELIHTIKLKQQLKVENSYFAGNCAIIKAVLDLREGSWFPKTLRMNNFSNASRPFLCD